MKEFKTKLEPYGRAFVNCESDNREYKTAAGIYGACGEVDIDIDKNTGLCSLTLVGYATGFSYSDSFFCSSGSTERECKEHPDDADELRYIRDEMKKFTEKGNWNNYFTDEHIAHRDEGHLWGGTWMGHANPNFGDIGLYGTDALRERICSYKEKNGKEEFYDALILTLDAIDLLGDRCKEKATKMLAEEENNAAETARLKKIVDTFSHATRKPARDFAEAAIVFTLVFSLDGEDSPGHFDQYMYEIWSKTDPALRDEYLDALWQYFHKTRTWNLCISGSDENWNDLTNDLSYAILDITAKYRYQTPNLTMRVHRNTPEKLLHAAYRAIATGCGMPTIYNDESVCPALESMGIPPHDAHEYVMNGCNQIDIQGKSHMGLEDGEVCIAKAVEFTLSNGISTTSGKKLGLETGDARDFKNFDEFYAAFIKQLDNLTDIACDMSNAAQRACRNLPNPLRSILIECCIEKGIDYKSGGPLYGHGQILAEGIADAVDSLANIKKFVFEDKTIPMDTLLSALENNFEGYDGIYDKLKNSDLKFGNDIEYVDKIAADVIDHFNTYLRTIPTERGGYFGGGCSPFNRADRYGMSLGALPNGHRSKDPVIADSIGAVPGCDTNGPTALLNSCLAFNHKLPISGFILNIKFDKSIFNTPEGEEAFLGLYHSYFDRGGQQLSVSVVSADELKDAKVHPECHRDLIVRVGGYSDYFVNLSPGNQDNVIARTSYMA